MLYVYTGNGKGKTTAAMGQIVRALGRGLRVCLIQLFKGEPFYGEQHILKKLPGLDFFSFASKHPGCFPKVTKREARKQCLKGLQKFEQILARKKKYDLIVLEEFNIALRDNYLKSSELLPAVKKAAPIYDVFVTGRGAPKALIAMADLVTEMKEVKHPYKRGIQARKGIEF